MKFKTAIIGTGNMAYFIGTKLKGTDFAVQLVYGRNPHAAKMLADKIQALSVDEIASISKYAQLVFLCVNDDQIHSFVANFEQNEKIIVVHCSGTKELFILEPIKNTAILWPIYSIIKNDLPTHRSIPIITEGNNGQSQKIIATIADEITNFHKSANYEERKILHFLAVITNNYINHLIAIGQEIAEEKKVDFDWIMPIVRQSVERLSNIPAKQLQTGPAIRNDQDTMNAHLQLLEGNKLWQEIYKNMAISIQSLNKKD